MRHIITPHRACDAALVQAANRRRKTHTDNKRLQIISRAQAGGPLCISPGGRCVNLAPPSPRCSPGCSTGSTATAAVKLPLWSRDAGPVRRVQAAGCGRAPGGPARTQRGAGDTKRHPDTTSSFLPPPPPSRCEAGCSPRPPTLPPRPDNERSKPGLWSRILPSCRSGAQGPMSTEK